MFPLAAFTMINTRVVERIQVAYDYRMPPAMGEQLRD